MTPSLKRAFLGVLTVLLFIILTAILYGMPSGRGPTPPLYANLARTVILSCNIAVFFAFLAFNAAFGLGLAILSSAFVLLFNIKLGMAGNSILAMSFFLTAYFGFSRRRAVNALNNSHRLKLEKTGEDINLLSNGISQKRKSISLVEEKLKRYTGNWKPLSFM